MVVRCLLPPYETVTTHAVEWMVVVRGARERKLNYT